MELDTIIVSVQYRRFNYPELNEIILTRLLERVVRANYRLVLDTCDNLLGILYYIE